MANRGYEPPPYKWIDGGARPVHVPAGHDGIFIVAVKRRESETVFVFQASYLNEYAVSYDDCCERHEICPMENGEDCPATGWFIQNETLYGDMMFAPLLSDGDELKGWQHMPKWNDGQN